MSEQDMQQNNSNVPTKKCKYCQSDIPKKAKICPNCRKKQGGIGKWILIAIVAIIIIVVATNGGDSGDTSATQSTTPSSAEKQTDTNKQAVSNENESSKAEAESGGVATAAAEIYSLLQENESFPYTLTSKAKTFLEQHDDLFPSKGTIDSSLIDNSLDYRQILKNESKYGDKLYSISEGGVVEIWEETIDDNRYFTTINLSDGEQQYIVFYNGELDGVYKDSYVSAVGLPLGTSYFDNSEGGTTSVVILAGCKVEPLD